MSELGSLAEIVAAGAALWAAVIVRSAVSDWKKGIERQRSDECIAAVSNCAAAIGRVLKTKQMYPSENLSDIIQAVWDKWSDFSTAYEVARSYNSHLRIDIHEIGNNIIYNMEITCREDNVSQSEIDKIKNEFGSITSEVKSKLSNIYKDAILAEGR